MAPAVGAAAITGAVGLGSSLIGANATANATQATVNANKEMTKEQLAEQAREFDTTFGNLSESQKNAYTQFLQGLGLAGTQLGLTESQFGQGLAQANQAQQIEAGQGDIIRKAYQEALKGGKDYLSSANAAFNEATGSTPAEILQLKEDIKKGIAPGLEKAANEYGAKLNLAGVTGGQAATLKGRQLGEMGTAAEKEIDALIAQDAATRQQQRAAYQAALGQKAQDFLLSPTSAQYTATGTQEAPEKTMLDVVREAQEATKSEADKAALKQAELTNIAAKATESPATAPVVKELNQLERNPWEKKELKEKMIAKPKAVVDINNPTPAEIANFVATDTRLKSPDADVQNLLDSGLTKEDIARYLIAGASLQDIGQIGAWGA